MITLADFLLWTIVFLFVASIYWYWTIPKNLPPGPLGLPFIGSSLEYLDANKQHLKLQEEVKKYGPVFKLYIGNKLAIILGNFDVIQEALVKQGDVFSGRPLLQVGMPEKIMGHGLVLSEGDLWKEQRRFALSTLRDFGVGRPIMEPRIKEETECLIESLHEYATSGQSFDPQRLITSAVSNIVNQLLFGRRFSYDDEEFAKHFMSLSKRTSADGVSFLSPFMLSDTIARLVIKLPLGQKMMRESLDFLDYVQLQIDKTVATYDPQSEPDNYIHAFLKARDTAAIGSRNWFNDAQLLASSQDLFSAGTDTTSTTIRWAILHLSHNPELQERLYREIKNGVGTSSLPSYADRTKLPFAEAVVMETQRIANLAPLGGVRRVTQATKLMGYDIPENAVIFPILTNILHNPEYYPNPMRYDPDRFMDENGKVIRDPKLIPFQIGKRICLGEPLARMELFLILVGLVSRFRFFFPQDQLKPTLDPIVGFTCSPTPFRVCVEARD